MKPSSEELGSRAAQRKDMLQRLVKLTEMVARGQITELGLVGILRDKFALADRTTYITGTAQNDTFYTFALAFLEAAQHECNDAVCSVCMSRATAHSALRHLAGVDEATIKHAPEKPTETPKNDPAIH